MTIIEKFLTSPILMLVVLIVLVLIGGLILVRWFPRSNEFWQKTDCWWLILSALGIFGLFGENRMSLAERDFNRLEYFDLYGCENRIKFSLNVKYFDIQFQETEFSPDYLKIMQEDYNNVSDWINSNRDSLLCKIIQRESIDFASLNFPLSKSPAFTVTDYYQELKEAMDSYNRILDEMEELQAKMDWTGFELIYIFFSPAFIVLGLAWRFIRYFGERKNLKVRAAE